MNANKSTVFTLLLVDDDPLLLESLAPLADDPKLSIRTATNGTKAIEITNFAPVHMAMVDLRLPDLSGTEVLEVIQAAHPNSLRWLMTGYSDFEAAARAVNRAGVHRIFIKPLNPPLVKSALRQGLEQLQAEQEREQLQTKLREANRRLAKALKRQTRDAHQFELELLRTRAELERTFWELVEYSRFSSLGLATGVLAHDIRNPLTVLSGQLQMLLAKGDEDPAIACRLAAMTRQVERIQNLLDGFSELSAGRVKGEREFGINEVLREALALVQKLYRAKGLEAIIIPEGVLAQVKGNYGHWVHVLFKLLEHIGQRAANSRVTIEVGEDEIEARIAIQFSALQTSDRPVEEMIGPRLVAEFSVSDPHRAAHADSMVFFLCSRILEQYGGRLEVHPSDHQTVFAISYPKTRESSAEKIAVPDFMEQQA